MRGARDYSIRKGASEEADFYPSLPKGVISLGENSI
jgi:hypothetical protein